MPPSLTLSIIRYGLWVKWSNPGKEIAPSSTPWCSSYRKGNLQVTLDYGCQLFLYSCFTRVFLYLFRIKNFEYVKILSHCFIIALYGINHT